MQKNSIMVNMTIISIAYRLTTLKNCDKIIVMDKGQIVQTGKFKKLMKMEGLFSDMYLIWQWLLFFYIYSFVGWVWESCYVSVQKRKWVNRGFLTGPFLPIYGCGALAVLVSTMPVRENILLIFLFGMIGATLLEYVTGWGMEKLFKVKYWDYSNQPLNVNGHICLMASLGWGLFSVAMVKGIHIPVERFVLGLPPILGGLLALALTVYLTADATLSFREAMDMREMLEKLQASRDYIMRMQKRLEVASAFAADDYKQYLAEREEKKTGRKERFTSTLSAMREARKKLLEELWNKTEQLKGIIGNTAELKETREGIRQELFRMGERRTKEYKKIVSHLRRNPKASSHKYQDVLDEIKKLL